MDDLYVRLAKHLENLTMGYPYTDELFDLLQEMFSPAEAQVALAIPNDLEPLQVVGLVRKATGRIDTPTGCSILPDPFQAQASVAAGNHHAAHGHRFAA